MAQVRFAMYPGYPAARGPVYQPALARPGAAQPFYPGARAAPPPTVIRCRFSSEDICTFILILQRAKVFKFGRAIFISQGTQTRSQAFWNPPWSIFGCSFFGQASWSSQNMVATRRAEKKRKLKVSKYRLYRRRFLLPRRNVSEFFQD